MLRKGDGFGGAGLLMLVVGGAMFLSKDAPAPLWVAWLVGPLLWYAGFGLMLVWMIIRFLGWASSEPEKQEEKQTVIKPVIPSRVHLYRAPQGVLHEIPAMGGFIL